MRNLLFNGLLCASASFALMACGGPEKQTDASSGKPSEPEVVIQTAPVRDVSEPEARSEEPAETVLAFDDMHLPDGDYYCTLMREGHNFDYHDLSSWKYVFVTELASDTKKASISYDSVVHAFEQSDASDMDNRAVWTYREAEGERALELNLQAVEKGADYINYEGLMTLREVSGGKALISQPVWGSCGV